MTASSTITIFIQVFLITDQSALAAAITVAPEAMLMFCYDDSPVRFGIRNAVTAYQTIIILIEETVAGRQHVGKVAGIILERIIFTAVLGILELAAGNPHCAVSLLLHQRRVDTASDGQGITGIGIEHHSRAAELAGIGDAAAANGVTQDETG